jgi:hypothetical protein
MTHCVNGTGTILPLFLFSSQAVTSFFLGGGYFTSGSIEIIQRGMVGLWMSDQLEGIWLG